VASKVGSLSTLVKNRKYVTVHLKSVAAEEGSTSASAKNVLRTLTGFKFVYMLHFLLEYPVVLMKLYLLFERKQLSLANSIACEEHSGIN
jgi:hypothetical protein